MNTCPIIDYVTHPFLHCSMLNNEGSSELCAAYGWIDEGWKHVVSTDSYGQIE